MADVDSLFDVFDDQPTEKTSSVSQVNKPSATTKGGKSTSDILKRHREDGLGDHIEEAKRLKTAVSDEIK